MSFKQFLQSELSEATVDVQVADVKDAIETLKAAGIKAKQAKLKDEVSIDLKDKKKVYAWMLDNGWDKEDIKELYPEVL